MKPIPKPTITVKPADKPKLEPPPKPSNKFIKPAVTVKKVNKYDGITTNVDRLIMLENQLERGKLTLMDNTEIMGYRKTVFNFPSYYDDDKNEVPIVKAFLPTELFFKP